MSKIKLKASAQNVRREHGVVCSFSDDFFIQIPPGPVLIFI